MGNEQSASNEVEDIVAYQVVRVMSNSPAEKAGLSPFFDFILEIDSISVPDETIEFFSDYIAKSQNQSLKMKVYSLKTSSFRDVVLIPNTKWGNEASMSMKLGCTIRYETARKAIESVWRILEVLKESQADIAGLRPNNDYIVGSGISLFHESDDFYTFIHSSSSDPLYVYNIIDDTFRYVLLPPKKEGETLGCDIGIGYIHQIPLRSESNPSTKLEMNDVTMKLSNMEPEKVIEKATPFASPRITSIMTPIQDSPNLVAIKDLMDIEKLEKNQD